MLTKKEFCKLLLKAKIQGNFGCKIEGLKFKDSIVKISKVTLESNLEKYDINFDTNIPSLDLLKGLVEGIIRTNCSVVVKDIEIDFDNETFEIGDLEVKESGANYDIQVNAQGNDTVYIKEEQKPESENDSKENSVEDIEDTAKY